MFLFCSAEYIFFNNHRLRNIYDGPYGDPVGPLVVEERGSGRDYERRFEDATVRVACSAAGACTGSVDTAPRRLFT